MPATKTKRSDINDAMFAPGRVLDALVAEHVFGHTVYTTLEDFRAGMKNPEPGTQQTMGIWVEKGQREVDSNLPQYRTVETVGKIKYTSTRPVPNYSTDIRDAYAVLKRILHHENKDVPRAFFLALKHGMGINLQVSEPFAIWMATTDHHPHIICVAAIAVSSTGFEIQQ